MSGFESAFAFVIGVEGGYVNDKNDPGGETKFGISKRAYPHLDIKHLTLVDAKAIYCRDYWQAAGCDRLEPRLALLVFDAAVNHGVGRARAWLAEHPTLLGFLAARLDFYTRLDTWPHFGKGWARRVSKLMARLAELEPAAAP